MNTIYIKYNIYQIENTSNTDQINNKCIMYQIKYIPNAIYIKYRSINYIYKIQYISSADQILLNS